MGGHIPEALALALRDEMELAFAVETGTFKGDTARWLAQHFERVWSIEMDAGWLDYAVAKCAGRYPNLHFVRGDSREKLAHVLAQLTFPALLWLDAHWCGGARAAQKPDEECPLREELEAITLDGREHAILIDDARLYVGRPEYPHDPILWPTFDEVQGLLPDNYYVCVHHDVIVAVPEVWREVVEAWADG